MNATPPSFTARKIAGAACASADAPEAASTTHTTFAAQMPTAGTIEARLTALLAGDKRNWLAVEAVAQDQGITLSPAQQAKRKGQRQAEAEGSGEQCA